VGDGPGVGGRVDVVVPALLVVDLLEPDDAGLVAWTIGTPQP